MSESCPLSPNDMFQMESKQIKTKKKQVIVAMSVYNESIYLDESTFTDLVQISAHSLTTDYWPEIGERLLPRALLSLRLCFEFVKDFIICLLNDFIEFISDGQVKKDWHTKLDSIPWGWLFNLNQSDS